MADIIVVPTAVVKGAGATVVNGTFGATVTAGQTVYLDPVTNTFLLSDADGAAALKTVAGIALNGGAINQPAAVITAGNYNPGVAVTVGVIYCLSATPGGIAPSTDLVSTWAVSILGVATTTSNILLNINNTGITKP